MPKEKTGGRQAGTPNKVSATVKENVLAVFNRLEGTAGMAKWAEDNKTEFYKIYAKLLPTSAEISGPDGNPLEAIHKVELVGLSPGQDRT